MVRVLFFGRLREAAGGAERDCAPPQDVRTVGALAGWLARDDAALAQALTAPGVRMARDQALCDADAPLTEASEVAFMSPFSGG